MNIRVKEEDGFEPSTICRHLKFPAGDGLIFTMLGERSTTEIHRTEASQGVPKLQRDAKRGGKIAGIARRELEKEVGRSMISTGNFKQLK